MGVVFSRDEAAVLCVASLVSLEHESNEEVDKDHLGEDNEDEKV
jgi:hypothetical protein